MIAPRIQPEPSHRGGVTLPEDCWDWLQEICERDGSTRDDLLEGLVRLGMDADEAKRARQRDGG